MIKASELLPLPYIVWWEDAQGKIQHRAKITKLAAVRAFNKIGRTTHAPRYGWSEVTDSDRKFGMVL